MCFGGFDAPDAGEQATYNYEASLLGVPPLGDVPVSTSGYVGPVSIETKGFSHNDKGEAVYQGTELGFSPRGTVETIGTAIGAGGLVATGRAVERGLELAQGTGSGNLDLGAGGGAVAAAPEAGGLPSVTAAASAATVAGTKNAASAQQAPLGGDAGHRTLPWLIDGATSQPSPDVAESEAVRARYTHTSADSSPDDHTDHAARLRRVLLSASDPSGPLSLRRRVDGQQPRLLGE